MRSRVTLADVAARAGTSKTTAHYVLNGRDQEMRISEDARQRVLAAAGELGYRPNLMARGLRTDVTRTIALITDTVASGQFAGQLVYGSLEAAARHGHLLFVCETDDDPEIETRLVEELLDRRVDAFLLATSSTREVEIPPALEKSRLVLLNCRAPHTGVPSVRPDEVQAGHDAVQVLLDAGHRDGIWVVGEAGEHVVAGRERRAGMRRALTAAGVELAGRVECHWWPESAFEAVDAWLAAGTRPRALVCLNDRVAMGAYQALARHGLRIPDDVSVVSFDDSDLASWLQPQLTSIAIPHYELATRAVDLLLADPVAEFAEHRVPMPVRLRDSVAPPA
ncbi:transcriptional regulator, LacI family [Klenkia soli]|uniref:Transcriptional regulator, LacI family n=1 Tax=Klenkia soli TaxID=1052260 RepID=A0A1H0MVE6_9ACTN|nr:LacI family DNA-binding transcriptional regulator [Klenkia soli]SDO84439.1 transcriptional regulator, LacI family [Klenkia soli]